MTATPFSPEDAHYMARALRLADRGVGTSHPNPAVGCVLVRDGAVVGEGWTRPVGGPHAEVEALRAAGDGARGATAYVTLEPCCHHGRTPPCSDALVAAGVARVVVAVVDPNPRVAGNGLRQLQGASIAVSQGLMEEPARALNRGFFRRMDSGRPWVTSKLAMSLDGRTVMASGESKWITGPEARQDVQRLRARSSALLTGIETVLADDQALTVRLEDDGATVRQPVRVVLDSLLRIPAGSRLLDQSGETWVLTGRGRAGSRPDLVLPRVAVHEVAAGADGRLDLADTLELLGRLEINELMVEAGATLNGALLRAGLVDEWVVYLAPCILGSRGRALFELPDLDRMADRYDLKLVDSRQVGGDLRLRFGRSTGDD